jgi:adenylyl- and sulfurtransferase ThiI
MDRAKAIGTYDTSVGPEICDLLGPSRPATAARVDQILEEETKLDIPALVEACLSTAVRENFKGERARVPEASAGKAPS